VNDAENFNKNSLLLIFPQGLPFTWSINSKLRFRHWIEKWKIRRLVLNEEKVTMLVKDWSVHPKKWQTKLGGGGGGTERLRDFAQLSLSLYGETSLKTAILILAAIRTWNLSWEVSFLHQVLWGCEAYPMRTVKAARTVLLSQYGPSWCVSCAQIIFTVELQKEMVTWFVISHWPKGSVVTPCYFMVWLGMTDCPLALWRRSSSKCYLRIQSVRQREHHSSPLERSTG
jgi:hypothetical protein